MSFHVFYLFLWEKGPTLNVSYTSQLLLCDRLHHRTATNCLPWQRYKTSL